MLSTCTDAFRTHVTGKARRRLGGSVTQSGQAMLVVIAALALMATIPVVVITTTVNQLPLTAENLNWNSAYEAGLAGFSDYVQQLDANQNFGQWTQGRTACSGTAPNSQALTPPGDQAFCGWVQVSTNPNEWFEYSLPSVNNGSLTLQVSGKAGLAPRTVVRTFDYTLVPTSALDSTYWSNYESIDPALNPLDGLNCTTAYYPSSLQSCWVAFDSSDILDGPVFTNDTIHVCGTPTFDDPVESGAPSLNPAEPTYAKNNSGGNCNTTPAGAGWPPVGTGTQPLPTTSAAATAAQNVGCYISGGTLANPTPVTVNMSLSTYPTTTPTTTQITWSGSGAGVVNTTGNPNTANCASPITLSNLDNKGSGLVFVNGNVVFPSNTNTDMGFLTIVAGGSTSSTTYGNITIEGSITYLCADVKPSCASPQSDSSDALGLVAQHFVQIPRGQGSLTIDAGILALSDSFYVENWGNNGIEGTLTVFGSIAKTSVARWRRSTGTELSPPAMPRTTSTISPYRCFGLRTSFHGAVPRGT